MLEVIIVGEMMFIDAIIMAKMMMNTEAATGQMHCCYEYVIRRWQRGENMGEKNC